MKPILIEAQIPENVTIRVRKQPRYRTFWNIYIEGHWLRSWYSYTVGSVSTAEEAISSFAESYYGHTVTTDKEKYPEEFL